MRMHLFVAAGTVLTLDIVSTQGFGEMAALDFKVVETPAPVPLPAAFWLMVSGLGSLGAWARKKRPAL